jgi:hypothetical protein
VKLSRASQARELIRMTSNSTQYLYTQTNQWTRQLEKGRRYLSLSLTKKINELLLLFCETERKNKRQYEIFSVDQWELFSQFANIFMKSFYLYEFDTNLFLVLKIINKKVL